MIIVKYRINKLPVKGILFRLNDSHYLFYEHNTLTGGYTSCKYMIDTGHYSVTIVKSKNTKDHFLNYDEFHYNIIIGYNDIVDIIHKDIILRHRLLKLNRLI